MSMFCLTGRGQSKTFFDSFMCLLFGHSSLHNTKLSHPLYPKSRTGEGGHLSKQQAHNREESTVSIACLQSHRHAQKRSKVSRYSGDFPSNPPFNSKRMYSAPVGSKAGGGDYYENYQLLCNSCNRIKGDRTMEYLRMKIETRERMMKNQIFFGE